MIGAISLFKYCKAAKPRVPPHLKNHCTSRHIAIVNMSEDVQHQALTAEVQSNNFCCARDGHDGHDEGSISHGIHTTWGISSTGSRWISQPQILNRCTAGGSVMDLPHVMTSTLRT